MSVLSVLSNENPAFRGYVICGSVLAVKMLAMSLLTGRQRRRDKAFANQEDALMFKAEKVTVSEDVERIRRAHLNDLENISVFFFVGFGYLLTEPEPSTALCLFRVFTVARVIHSLVYVAAVKPPIRGVAWLVGFSITGYMALRTITYFLV